MKIFKKIIIFICIGVMTFSGFQLYKIIKEYLNARTVYGHVAKEVRGKEIDWDALHKINPYIVGWIYIKDTPIDYPVVKYIDNSYYLHRLIDNTYNFAGTIFIDCNCEDNLQSFNTILYGHHMKDGSMFARIDKYIRDENFYESHPYFEYYTPEGNYKINVIAAGYTTDGSNAYTIETDEEDIIDYFNIINNINILPTDINIIPTDHLMTLSTCVYSEGPERYIVIGKISPYM